jgi:hypothetical protein
MVYNLNSPYSIQAPVTLDNVEEWFREESSRLPNGSERQVLVDVAVNVDSFVNMPSRAVLLWRGCNRVPVPPARQRYHRYPDELKIIAKHAQVYLDGRPNGPAIAAFLYAGGSRPKRYGSSNAWSIHHLYSGKFPYVDRKDTTHAAKSALHFTQSAGLVAVHPIADALVDEFPPFAWLARARAYLAFGYDPDGVFGEKDELGFAPGRQVEIVHTAE